MLAEILFNLIIASSHRIDRFNVVSGQLYLKRTGTFSK
jgi:hypothetical protein